MGNIQPPKRQIIKTRPQRPYIVARIVLVIIALVVLLVVMLLLAKPHAARGAPLLTLTVQVQEALPAARTAPILRLTEHPAHEYLHQRPQPEGHLRAAGLR